VRTSLREQHAVVDPLRAFPAPAPRAKDLPAPSSLRPEVSMRSRWREPTRKLANSHPQVGAFRRSCLGAFRGSRTAEARTTRLRRRLPWPEARLAARAAGGLALRNSVGRDRDPLEVARSALANQQPSVRNCLGPWTQASGAPECLLTQETIRFYGALKCAVKSASQVR